MGVDKSSVIYVCIQWVAFRRGVSRDFQKDTNTSTLFNPYFLKKKIAWLYNKINVNIFFLNTNYTSYYCISHLFTTIIIAYITLIFTIRYT